MRLHETRLSWLIILCFIASACSLLLLLDQTLLVGNHRTGHMPDVTPKALKPVLTAIAAPLAALLVPNRTLPANSVVGAAAARRSS